MLIAAMNTPDQDIAYYKKFLSNKSDEELIKITLQHASSGEVHIAAKLLLEERAKQAQDIKDKAQETREHETLQIAKKANRLSIIAIIFAALSLAAFVADFVYRTISSRSNGDPKQPQVQSLPAVPQASKETSPETTDSSHTTPKQDKLAPKDQTPK